MILQHEPTVRDRSPHPPSSQMHYPSLAEYTDALQLGLSSVLSDPLLRRGALRRQGAGLPVVRSGNFALTFELLADGQRYALRCFHKPADSLQARYDAIRRHLGDVDALCFVAFEFQPLGITTDSGTYPVVKMEWAEGEDLAAFIAAYRHDAGVLQQLRASLRTLARHLRDRDMAHGDLQPTNIILRSPSQLKLIDYDGMFVPELATLRSLDLGQRNFQHPGRQPSHFGPDLDAFSFAVIDVALEALCLRPDLWEATRSGEDALIFRAADFADPSTSSVFGLLSGLPGLAQRSRQLAAICVAPFESIPSFEDFLSGQGIPPVAVLYTTDSASTPGRSYVSPHPVIDAADFVDCCNHVGDRVELIGRIVNVVSDRLPPLEDTYLRLEFGPAFHDMACVKIWADALSRMRMAPDASWIGRWVSVVGVVEPVYTDLRGARPQKDVSISVSGQSQLHQLAEDEAAYRLRGRAMRRLADRDATGAVVTDPVVVEADPVAVAEPDAETEIWLSAQDLQPATSTNPSPSAVKSTSGIGWPSRWIVTAFMAVAVAIGAIAAMRGLPPPASSSQPGETTSSTGSPSEPERSSPTVASGRLVSQQDLARAVTPIMTVAGALDVTSEPAGGAQRVVKLDGQAVDSLRSDTLVLAHRTVYSDHEVIVGFTSCNGDAPPCGLRRPFWLELRPGSPPVVRRLPDLWASSQAGPVAADEQGVHVDLGVWDGDRRVATLSTLDEIGVTKSQVKVQPLSSADCTTVARALDACSASRTCATLDDSAQAIPSSLRMRLNRVYHEQTGLDATAFQALCMRSCQLGLTPSRAFIRTHVCAGAQAGQWPARDPGLALVR